MTETRAEMAERYRAGLVESYRSGFVKVHVSLGEPDIVAGETLWAQRTDKPDEFVIDNNPFFTNGIARGDTVRAYHPDDVANPLYFEFAEIAKPGPFVTIRIVGQPDAVYGMRDSFAGVVQVERGHDLSEGEVLFSVAVKREARLRVARWMRRNNMLWEWG